MVQKIKCQCLNKNEMMISTYQEFIEMKNFFQEQISSGVFEEIDVKQPYYIGYSRRQTIRWFADKWYKCKVCGCLWEFNYPDFPAAGFTRKFNDGIYCKR